MEASFLVRGGEGCERVPASCCVWYHARGAERWINAQKTQIFHAPWTQTQPLHKTLSVRDDEIQDATGKTRRQQVHKSGHGDGTLKEAGCNHTVVLASGPRRDWLTSEDERTSGITANKVKNASAGSSPQSRAGSVKCSRRARRSGGVYDRSIKLLPMSSTTALCFFRK